MRWAVSAGLIAVIAGTASADEATTRSGVELRLQAPEGCPTAARLAEKLDAAIEVEVVAATVQVTVTRSRRGFELELVIDERREQARRLRATRCDEVVDAAVLILSLALLPDEPEPEPEPVAEARPALEEPPPPGTEEEPPVGIVRPLPAGPRLSVSLGAAAAVDGGTLPGIAGGVGVALSARRGKLSLGATATYFPTHRAVIDPEMSAGAEINATAIGLRGCRRGGPLWLCLGGEVNILGAAGVGVETTERDEFLLWGLTAATRYELSLGRRLSLAATGELVGHPARPAYFLENPRRLVHRPGWLSGRLWLVGQIVIY